MTETRLFDIVKPSDFVLALSADEGTKVDFPYRVVSVWRDENGGQGITVELEDGCGAGLNQGEYEPLFRANARPMTVAEAAKVLLDNTPNPTFDILKYPMMGEFKQSIAMQDEDGEEVWRDVTIEWTTIKEIFAAGLRALSQGGE